MNKKILEETNIYMGIDTLQVTSDEESKLTPEQAPYISKIVRVDPDRNTYSYRLNPDKANKHLQIYNSEDFKEIYSFMILEMGFDEPRITRVDFRIDSFDDNFEQLMKLNKLLILLLSQTYKLDNRYQSDDPLTLDDLCIRVQNRKLEVENYNKGLEEPTGNVMNRLELRTKNISDSQLEIIHTEFEKWCRRLEKAVTKENFEKLQETSNFYLVKKYNKAKSDRVTVNEFLYKYSGNVWTRSQLINFFEQIGCKNPAEKAHSYKRRKKIEYFSFRDLEIYVSKIKKAGFDFFENSQNCAG